MKCYFQASWLFSSGAVDQQFPKNPAQEITSQRADDNGDPEATKKSKARKVCQDIPGECFCEKLVFQQEESGDPESQAEDNDDET